MSGQMALAVGTRDDPDFANFVTSRSNRLVVNSLRQMIESTGFGFTYLWGAPGSGRTHLLLAACRAVPGSIYLPLSELATLEPADVLLDLEANALVAVDDIDSVLGQPDWEIGLFGLFNRCLEAGVALLSSAACAALHSEATLPDLRSRLSSGLSLHLCSPDDDEKAGILMHRARLRGMQMAPDVAQYILSRADRNMAVLITLLDRIDACSLREQRRLTLPFVRNVLNDAVSPVR